MSSVFTILFHLNALNQGFSKWGLCLSYRVLQVKHEIRKQQNYKNQLQTFNRLHQAYAIDKKNRFLESKARFIVDALNYA